MITNKFQYWPSNGQLGSTKFTMPTNAEDWPSGDALVGNFVYSEGELVDFIDTKALVANSSGTTTFPYDYVNITVDKSLEGVMTFNKGSAKYFTVTYAGSSNSGDTVIFKYMGCKTVDDIKAVDPNYLITDIVDGVWSEILADLEQGSGDYNTGMFISCLNLTSFSSDLSSLTNGTAMFAYCSQLNSFSSDLSSLVYGVDMFNWCISLTSFTSDLSSLTNGSNIFNKCKLDAPSVKNIIDTINTYSAKLTLGMGCNDTAEDKDLFAQEVGYADMNSLLATLQAKGWTVTAQYNGRPTTTYSLRRPSEDTLPIFVKLEEVKETEEHADYTSEDGSKKYRLNYFHETTDSTDGYTQFNSLEEAINYFNVKPIERD